MKVELIRASGLPISEEEILKYRDEWRTAFDKFEEKFRAENRLNDLPPFLDKLERRMLRKYSMVLKVELPTNNRQWVSLWNTYGNIMVAKRHDKEKTVLVIIDKEVG